MKAIWCTDIHLNFLSNSQRTSFFNEITSADGDIVLISGDISVGPTVEPFLREMAETIQQPIYFVLGNHDYWESSFAKMHQAMLALSKSSPYLQWLGQGEGIPLREDTGLLGHDSWYDGRFGNYADSRIRLNDFIRITDFAYMSKAAVAEKLAALGDEAASYIRHALPQALLRFKKIIFLTHVPPFRAACWHEGKISNENWLPFMSCQAVGEALQDIMAAHPQQQMTVLCGHTHSAGEVQILPNLEVKTGAALYGQPGLQKTIEIGA